MSKKLKFSAFSVFALAILIALPLVPRQVSALSGSEFQAGRIIDDGVFFNAQSMNETQIQEFLNAKVPECDTNGDKLIYDSSRGDTVTRRVYSERRGVYPPFTCLKDFRQDTGNKAPEDMLCNGHTAGNKSAARIIKEVADSCGVSPKMLIILLQKEQSLVTDDWPWPRQYRSATGYGCPDTAPCDAQYYGFFNQVYNAARIYKYYAKYPNSFNHLAGRNNNILYHPNSACGRGTVFIQNQATAGLYNYTPYQPNTAALNNLYGLGDGCSSYGNRNFWRMFNDWFGSTYSPSYAWQLTSQYAYTDANKTTVKNMGSLSPGERVYVGFTARNTGNVTWTNSGPNAIIVGTTSPMERQSRFYNAGDWLSPTRPALMKEASVAPGQTATFEFWMTAPSAPNTGGTYNERFNILASGITWFNDIGLSFYANVAPATYTWQLTGQYSYTDTTKTTIKKLDNLLPGEKAYVGFTAKNTGNMTWKNSGANPVSVGTLNPSERVSGFAPGSSWLSPTRPALMKEASVAPGQTATFEFWMTAPNKQGISHERFGILANGLTWFNDTGLSFYTNVVAPIYSWQMVSQYAYTDASKTTVKNIADTLPGEKLYIGFTAKNTGNMTWKNSGANPVSVGTLSPHERVSDFATGSNWLSPTRPALMKEASVAPGQTATFEFWMTAPATQGIYNERFGLVANGLTWLNDTGLSYYINVHN